MTEQVKLEPEPWTYHLLGLISPLLVISGNLLGVYEPIYAAMGVIFIWFVGPILDVVMGETKVPRPPRESGTPFIVLLWTHGILQLFVMATFFWFAYNTGLTVWLVVGALSTGLSAAASATVTAHELGHQKRKSPGWWLSRVLLFSINYTHFTAEHNYNHHRWVATDKDPASATEEESLWFFWARTIPGQFFSSVRIHNKRGKTGFSNPSYQGLGLQIFCLAGLAFLPGYLGFFDGVPLTIGWMISSLVSILTLEYVNYIRHWGLRRGKGRFKVEHAWNTEARWSRWSLLELTRHSDHHMDGTVPFWKLRPHKDTPTLKWGYYASWWPCVITPIWRWAMTERLPSKSD
tara:strand:+ start:3284 stop:4327 length:1044 start_codon:yes stop_codon:yes gene_type:complete